MKLSEVASVVLTVAKGSIRETAVGVLTKNLVALALISFFVTFSASGRAAKPSAPSNLRATSVSTSEIDLTWTDTSSFESGFKIERARSSSGPWTQIAAVGPSVTSYADTGLTAATVYYYRARSYTGKGNSAYSNIASATTGSSVPACSYAISSTGAPFASDGGSGSFDVTASAGSCAWNASSSSSWLLITGGSSGSGNGTVSYTVAVNGTASSRTGTISAAGQTFTVTQAAAPACTYSLSPANASCTSDPAAGSVVISAGAGCSWAATANDTWLTITSGTSGSGNGMVNYSAAANNTPTARTGTLTIASQTFSVAQAGIPAIPLAQALDNTSLTWVTGGDAPWACESSFSVSGGSAAQSGMIGDGQSSWVETTVAGPGTLSFYWKVSSEAGWDSLRVTLDGVEQANITGEVDWQQKSFSIPSDIHTVRWTYAKDPGCCAAGYDRAWLDSVQVASLRCAYSVSPSGWTHGAGAESGSFVVTTSDGCGWSASTGYGWIHTSSSSSGSGTVAYTVDANTSTSARTGTIAAGGQTFTVNQAGITCSYALNPLSFSHGAGAESGSFSVTAPGGCTWSASTIYGWIHTTSSGNGSDTVSYSVDANTGTSARSGTITAGGQTFTVNQAGISCTYSLSPAGANPGSAGGNGGFTVTAPGGCSWTSSSAYGWIHTASGGSGNGTVTYSIDSNTSTSSRSGTVVAGGQTFSVTQAGISCTYSLSPTSLNNAAGTDSGSFSVTAPSGCGWSASTAYSWIHTSSSGNGNGTVSYTVDANTSTSARSGTITAGGQTFTVNQAGISCTYTLSPVGANPGSAGGNAGFTVTAPGGCAWTSSSAYGWIHTASGGNGNGTVTYSIDANSSASGRSGTIAAGGQTFTVNQAGISCTYSLSPASANPGSAGGNGSFTVTAPGGCAWTASTANSWIHTSSGGNGNGTVTFTVDFNAGASLRSGAITVGGQTFTVNQSGNQVPIAVAGSDQTVTINTSVSFNGTSSYDPDGTIASYSWSFGDGGTASGPSVSHTYSAAGAYTATLNVTDNLGASGSSYRIITVSAPVDTNAPVVTLSVSPSPNVSGTVTLSSSAVDNVGVTRVEFYRDGSLITSDTIAPYSATFDTRTIADGSHTFTAKAYDAAANNASASATILVDNTAPTVGLTSPTAGATVSGSITVSANASDSGSGVARVEFYLDSVSTPVTTVSSPPYSYASDTTTIANGAHTLYCKAFDVVGNSATSSSVAVTVNNGTSLPGQYQWASVPGGVASDEGAAVATDASGNVYMTGSCNGNYVFLAKYSPSGAQLWWQTFQATGVAHGVAVDSSGNAYITGEYTASANFGGGWLSGMLGSYSVFVAKISPAGTHVWSRGFPGYNYGRSIALDRNGNVYVTGTFASIDFGGGLLSGLSGGSIYVAKLSGADGSHVWSKQFGASGSCGNGIAVDGNGNLFVTGYCLGTTDFGGGPMDGVADYQAFLVKLTSAGAHVWSKGFGAMNGSKYGGNSVGVGPNGEVAMAGGFVGTIDFGGGAMRTGTSSSLDTDIFFAKFTGGGSYVWSKQVAGSANTSDTGYGAAVDGDGNMVFTGGIYGSGNFGTGTLAGSSMLSIYVVKYSPTGTCSWAKVYGGNNTGCGITVDGSKNVIATGQWYGTVDFGGGPVTSVGGLDAFLLKLAP